jgi:hypothetical protein
LDTLGASLVIIPSWYLNSVPGIGKTNYIGVVDANRAIFGPILLLISLWTIGVINGRARPIT